MFISVLGDESYEIWKMAIDIIQDLRNLHFKYLKSMQQLIVNYVVQYRKMIVGFI